MCRAKCVKEFIDVILQVARIHELDTVVCCQRIVSCMEKVNSIAELKRREVLCEENWSEAERFINNAFLRSVKARGVGRSSACSIKCR